MTKSERLAVTSSTNVESTRATSSSAASGRRCDRDHKPSVDAKALNNPFDLLRKMCYPPRMSAPQRRGVNHCKCSCFSHGCSWKWDKNGVFRTKKQIDNHVQADNAILKIFGSADLTPKDYIAWCSKQRKSKSAVDCSVSDDKPPDADDPPMASDDMVDDGNGGMDLDGGAAESDDGLPANYSDDDIKEEPTVELGRNLLARAREELCWDLLQAKQEHVVSAHACSAIYRAFRSCLKALGYDGNNVNKDNLVSIVPSDFKQVERWTGMKKNTDNIKPSAAEAKDSVTVRVEDVADECIKVPITFGALLCSFNLLSRVALTFSFLPAVMFVSVVR